MSRANPSQVTPKTAAVVSLTVLGVAFAAWFVWRTTAALLVTAAALLIAVALNRIVEWLGRHHVRRGLGIAIAMFAVLAVIVGVGFLLVPPVVTQVEQLVTEWPKLVASAHDTKVYHLLDQYFHISHLKGLVEKHAGEAVGPAISAVSILVESVAGVVTVLFVTLFMLAVGGKLIRTCLAQTRPERRGTYGRVLSDVYRALGGYVAGHLFIVSIQCAATTLFLGLLHVPFFLPLGLVSGLASLIPFAGVTIIGTVVSLIAWGTRGLAFGLATAAYYVVYQQFENHVLYPMVYRRTVEVNPLLIILAVLFFAEWGGIPGAVLAVPFVAAAHIVLGAILRARRERLDIPPPPANGEESARV